MNNINFQEYLDFFKKYTDKYIAEEKDITKKNMMKLKVAHTYNVTSNMEILARAINMNNYEINVAKIIGLLHDVGRFEQAKVYGTFSDKISTNHAKLSALKVSEFENLKALGKETYGIIYSAVYHHNEYRVEYNGMQYSEKVFVDMIRDADRIDIFRVLLDDVKNSNEDAQYHCLGETMFSSIISDKIYNEILNGISPDLKDAITMADGLIIRMSLVYESSFKTTLNTYLKKDFLKGTREYILSLEKYDILNNKNEKVLEHIKKETENKLEQNRKKLDDLINKMKEKIEYLITNAKEEYFIA